MKDSKIDPKFLHSHVHSKQCIQDRIHSSEKEDGSITTEHREMCFILNENFESVFVKETTGDMPAFEIRTKSECHLESAEITFVTIESRLKDLIETKS